MSGCTPRQLLWQVKLPLAVPSIMLGLNQTIMFGISMLVITALVGTDDLGRCNGEGRGDLRHVEDAASCRTETQQPQGLAATRTSQVVLGLDVESVGSVFVEDERVSSTAIRAACDEGDMDRASRFLGRPPNEMSLLHHEALAVP